MEELVLVGDIGGTNSRFALAKLGDTTPDHVRRYENVHFPSFQSAIENYVKEVGLTPQAAVVAIAGPVAGDVVGPTNLPRWRFRPRVLATALSLSRLDVINDFEAGAYSLPHLPREETVLIGSVDKGAPEGNLAVLGPGTGLGVGALVRAKTRWTAVPSEGGHADISPPIGAWAAAHEVVRRQVGRVSGEHVLSGPGLERLDAALRQLAGSTEHLTAAEIGTRAVAGSDPIAVDAVRLFFDYLARFSGDVALMFAAKGGVFLYGGVVQKLSTFLDGDRFRTAFEAKGPLEPFLEQIPLRLITNAAPGLIGCAAVAKSW